MNQYGKIPSISMMRVKVTRAINLDMFLINLLLFPLSSLLEDTARRKLTASTSNLPLKDVKAPLKYVNLMNQLRVIIIYKTNRNEN